MTGSPPPAQALHWVEEGFGPGARVTMSRRLPSTRVRDDHALLVVTRSGNVHRAVLHRWLPPVSADWSPEREIAALALLTDCRVPTPLLISADPAGVRCGAPSLLVTRLPGQMPEPAVDELPEYVSRLAVALARVHAMPAGTLPPYRPFTSTASLPPEARWSPLWQDVMEVASGPAPAGPAGFLHRWPWPTATLWTYGELSGLVGWAGASYGPVATDVAVARCALALRYGRSVADRFTADYAAFRGDGYRHDPYWDLRALADMCAGPAVGPPGPRDAAIDDYAATLLAELRTPTPHPTPIYREGFWRENRRSPLQNPSL